MPGQNFDETIISSGNNPFNIKLLIGLLVVLLLAGVGMGYYLYSKGVIDLSFLPKSSRTTPVPSPMVDIIAGYPQRSTIIMDCNLTKESHSLVRKVIDVAPDLRQIDFQGEVIKLVSEPNVFIITLLSSNGTQTSDFSFESDETFFIGDQEMKITDLKRGDEIQIFYNCTPGIDNDLLRFSRINKIQE